MKRQEEYQDSMKKTHEIIENSKNWEKNIQTSPIATDPWQNQNFIDKWEDTHPMKQNTNSEPFHIISLDKPKEVASQWSNKDEVPFKTQVSISQDVKLDQSLNDIIQKIREIHENHN